MWCLTMTLRYVLLAQFSDTMVMFSKVDWSQLLGRALSFLSGIIYKLILGFAYAATLFIRP